MNEVAELAARLHKILTGTGATLAVAESCTGGKIAAAITSVPGSSAYFKGGVVAYANEAKTALLEVDPELIERNGAVDAAVAEQMAQGARKAFGASFAVATTGIAGPDGGTEERPVGLVYIATACPRGADSRRFVFAGDRNQVRIQAAKKALEMLLEGFQSAAGAAKT